MTGEEILCWREGAIEWIAFNRPQVRNAMSSTMRQALLQALARIEKDDSVRALVLTGVDGERPAFMSGMDLNELAQAHTFEASAALEASADSVLAALEALPVPTLAALQGACVGMGALIALACDVRLAATTLGFGFPMARTLGNCLSLRNWARVAHVLGAARAKELIFSAELLDAPTLQAAGALREVVAPDALKARAQFQAEALAALAPATLYATRQACIRLRDRGLEAEEGTDLQALCYTAPYMQQVLAALRTRLERSPKNQG